MAEFYMGQTAQVCSYTHLHCSRCCIRAVTQHNTNCVARVLTLSFRDSWALFRTMQQMVLNTIKRLAKRDFFRPEQWKVLTCPSYSSDVS